MIQSLLFDLDGTLLDTHQDVCMTVIDVCQFFNIKPPTPQQIRPYVSLGTKKILETFVPAPTYAKLKDHMFEYAIAAYQRHSGKHAKPFECIETTLEHLDNHHIPWGIVTNKLEQHTHPLLDKLGWLRRLAVLVCGDTMDRAKPDPMGVEFATQKINKPKKNTLFIGDHPIDILAGHKAGVQTAMALWGYTPEKTADQLKPTYQFDTTMDFLNFVQINAL